MQNSIEIRRILSLGAGAWMCMLALSVLPARSLAQDPTAPRSQLEQTTASIISAFSVWLEARFSAAELKTLQARDLQLESHYCGCYDEPVPHYPYPLVVLRTPRGDLVARPDSHEGVLSFVPLAVRHGDRYCEVESEQACFGTFAEPCDFTDFRYGPSLQPFFPTCKSHETGSSSPLDANGSR